MLNKEQLVKRLKSLGFRTLCVALVAGLGYVSENLAGLEIPIALQAFLGLVLGEVTKVLNKNQDLFGFMKK